MSGDLYPTKTRLGLLAEIANGQVLTDITADDDVILLFPWAPTQWQDRVKVTARVREMERAGWVETDTAGVTWQLTERGRAFLDAAAPSTAAAAIDEHRRRVEWSSPLAVWGRS